MKVKEDRKAEVLKHLKRKWEEVYPNRAFMYQDIGAILEEANRDVVMLTDVLSLYAAISLLLTFSGLFGTLYRPSAPAGNRLAEDTWSFFWAHTVDIIPFVCSGVGNSFSDSCTFGVCLHDAVAGAFSLLCPYFRFTFSDTVGNYSWNHFPYRMAKRL